VVTVVDVIVIFLAVGAAVRGWRRGLVGQVFEFGGGFVGLLIGIWIGPRVAAAFTQRAGLEGALISLLIVFIMLSLGQTIGFIIGHRFGDIAAKARLGSVNSLLGSGLGVLITLVSFWLIGSLLIAGPSQSIAQAFKRSAVLRVMGDVMPRTPGVLAYLRQYLNTSGFPQVFLGLPRPLAGPVDPPPQREARRAIAAAQESTVRIVVPACGGTQLGSGWVAADSTVVTNAHVVAGGDGITIQDAGGDHVGRVVLFDPATDIAVLRTDGLAGHPLPLSSVDLERGAGGATLGFPGGGGLDTHAAAVQDEYNARGLDIYGRSTVTRAVYELRSPVREGDSGGPFVLPGGKVAGVVFAASTTNPDTGYALTGAEVEDEVRDGITSSDPVTTGTCTH
jgi:S1-C subfamily serine protease